VSSLSPHRGAEHVRKPCTFVPRVSLDRRCPCRRAQSGSVRTFNRLSRFVYDSKSATNTRNSEESILESSDKNYIYHSAGWLGFKPSAYKNSNVSIRCSLSCRASEGGRASLAASSDSLDTLLLVSLPSRVTKAVFFPLLFSVVANEASLPPHEIPIVRERSKVRCIGPKGQRV